MKTIRNYESQICYNKTDYRIAKFNIPKNHYILDIRLMSTCDVLLSTIVDGSNSDLVELELFFLVNNDIVNDDIEYIKTVEFYGYVYSVFRKRQKLFLEPTPA